MRRALALALLVVAACGDGGDGKQGATALADGRHRGQVVALDPGEFRLELETERGRHALVMADDVRVRLRVPCCDLHETPFAEWHERFEPTERTFYGTSDSRYWVTVDGGRVVEVEESADDDDDDDDGSGEDDGDDGG